MMKLHRAGNIFFFRISLLLFSVGVLLILVPNLINGGKDGIGNPISLIGKTIGNQITPAKPRAITPRDKLSNEEQATIKLFKKASHSVVFITSLAMKRSIFSLDVMQIPQGNGSGFVWDNKGHIVTNNHVIQKADAAHVTLINGSTYTARLVGSAPENDLAVLRIEAPSRELKPIEVGRSDNLSVGQSVFAIGNPFGLDHTLSKGVISGLGRALPSPQGGSISGLIQTDAAINPGNSGGPLLDSAGRIIGVNTAIFSPTGAYAGIGFAIPVDIVNRLVPQLIQHGRVIRPRIGIQLGDDSLLSRIGIEGVLILDVVPGSPADRQGLRGTSRENSGRIILGDIIIAIDGRPIKRTADLFRELEKYDAGDTVTLQVIRNRSKVDVRVQLAPGS